MSPSPSERIKFRCGFCSLLFSFSIISGQPCKVGFGLWNYRDPEFALEIALLALGIALYLARNAIPAIRKGAVIAFGIALVVIQIGDTYVPRTPLSDKATALGVWIFYTLFVLIALAVEKIGRRLETNAPPRS